MFKAEIARTEAEQTIQKSKRMDIATSDEVLALLAIAQAILYLGDRMAYTNTTIDSIRESHDYR